MIVIIIILILFSEEDKRLYQDLENDHLYISLKGEKYHGRK